ncbi:hypothetical protein SAMN05192533_10870 [Mesobacillus persicus]|uniref:Uncharacterized protein n=1 Tax=Mesobacillus persicus TaxID=930146 RepID=A0A1H8D3K9_9BACI|nr:hypothetical protein SAMN05192533_10870 [Mesobacillus persicus]
MFQAFFIPDKRRLVNLGFSINSSELATKIRGEIPLIKEIARKID